MPSISTSRCSAAAERQRRRHGGGLDAGDRFQAHQEQVVEHPALLRSGYLRPPAPSASSGADRYRRRGPSNTASGSAATISPAPVSSEREHQLADDEAGPEETASAALGVPRPFSFSRSFTFVRDTWIAGARPNSTPVARQSSIEMAEDHEVDREDDPERAADVRRSRTRRSGRRRRRSQAAPRLPAAPSERSIST